MLVRDFFLVKKDFFYVLRLRSIFLFYNFLIFFSFFSFPSNGHAIISKLFADTINYVTFVSTKLLKFTFGLDKLSYVSGNKVILICGDDLLLCLKKFNTAVKPLDLYPYLIIYNNYILKSFDDMLIYYFNLSKEASCFNFLKFVFNKINIFDLFYRVLMIVYSIFCNYINSFIFNLNKLFFSYGN